MFKETGDVEFESEGVRVRWFPFVVGHCIFLLAQVEGGVEFFEWFEEGFSFAKVDFVYFVGELDGIALDFICLLFA